MDSLIVSLIWLLIYALLIALACYIVSKLIAQFLPDAVPYTWIVWCIGGLILLLLALRLFSPVLGG